MQKKVAAIVREKENELIAMEGESGLRSGEGERSRDACRALS